MQDRRRKARRFNFDWGRRGFLITILTSYLLVWTLPMLTFSLASVPMIDRARDDVVQRNEAMLRQVAQLVDRKLHDLRVLMQQIAGNTRVQRLLNRQPPLLSDDHYDIALAIQDFSAFTIDSALAMDFFIFLEKPNLVITSSSVYRPELFYRTLYSFAGVDYEAWCESLRGMGAAYHQIEARDLIVNGQARRALLYMQTLPVTSFDRPTALAVVLVDPAQFEDLLAQPPGGGALYVLNEASEALLGAGGDLRGLDTSRDGTTYQIAANGECAVTCIPSRERGWRYVSVAPTEVYLRAVHQLRGRMVSLLAACTAVSMALIALLALRSYRPIERLYRAVPQADGPEARPLNELDHIARSFKAALDRQEHLERRLEDTLERQRGIKRLLEGNSDAIRGNLLQSILTGAAGHYKELELMLRYLDIRLPYDRFGVAMVLAEASGGAEEAQIALRAQLVATLERELSPDGALRAYANAADERRVCLLYNCPAARIAEARGRIRAACALAVREAESIPGARAFAGVGGEVDDLYNVDIAYQQALAALDYHLLMECQPVVLYEDILSQDKEYYYPIEVEAQLINALRAGDLACCRRLLDAVFEENLVKRKLQPRLIRYAFMDIACTAVKAIGGLNAELGLVDEGSAAILDRLANCRRAGEFCEELSRLMENVCTLVNRARSGGNQALRKRLLAIIEARYADADLTQTSIADALGVSPSYLSRFFKQELGENMLSHINRRRVEEAKRLLRKTDLRLEEIAERTGLNSSKTLIRVFKQYEGVTPGAYRASCPREDSR